MRSSPALRSAASADRQAHTYALRAGVIGQQPVLEPGACFVYHSGACLPCPGGQMLGHFQMQVLDGLEQEGFDAVIKPFKFLAPAQLQ